MARLMTALIGMMAESGEFAEVVKEESISEQIHSSQTMRFFT